MNHKILLIDGDEVFAQGLREACSARKLDLLVSVSAREGIEAAWNELPSAIVLSVELPDQNGYLVCSALRKHARLSRIPLVLISAKASPSEFERHKSLRGHADHYFSKPVAAEAIVAAVQPSFTGTQEAWFEELSGIPADKPEFKPTAPSFRVYGIILLVLAVLGALGVFLLRL